MRRLVLFYSFTGNNRRLAHSLAARLGAEIEEVCETRTRRILTVILDMAFNRRPAVRPLTADPAAFDHVILVAPIWDMNLAHPMASALRGMAGRLGPYSFVTLCGYRREGQTAHIREELSGLAGHPPDAVDELHVGALFPPEDRDRVKKISAYRITEDDLPAFETEIAAICRRLNVPADPAAIIVA